MEAMPEKNDIVEVEIAGRQVPARILATDVEAQFGPGPKTLYRVLVPNAGTFRVPESDILAS